MRCSWMPLIVLAGCSEYDIKNTGDGNNPADTGADGDSGDPPQEICDGVDNNGDGQVDEGYPDTDGDGTADCVDQDCEADEAAAGTVAIDETCLAPDVVVTDPWNVRIEWQWSSLPSSSVGSAIMMPAIGGLTDDNGDGAIDEQDTPDVAFVAFSSSNISSGTLIVLDGQDGALVWSDAGWSGGGGIALADVDGDGRTDIIGFDVSGRPRAMAADGTPLWTATSAVTTGYPQATVADLDGDGRPEVIADTLVLDGRTGSLLRTLGITGSIAYRMPAVGDIDLDGEQEVIIGNIAYNPDGTEAWRSSVQGGYGHWSAILDADGDPEAEVLMIGGGQMAVLEHDGSVLHSASAGGSQPGPPCVADFDGDGAVEAAWASSSQITMYELDGTAVWSASVDDSSGLAACSGYDADGDGVYEVLFADQNTFHIFDGATGAIRYSQGGHASGTLWEYPTVADVDNDGSAEIVIVSNNYYYAGWSGVTVFGHDGDGWMKSGTTWHTHDFAVSNINPDGTVPASPTPPWQIYNVYRARPSVDTAALDLQPAIVDACWAGCADDSPVLITAQARNTGGAPTGATFSLSLYAEDGTLLDTARVGPLGGGETTASVTFSATASQVADGFTVAVDEDGSGEDIAECDELNNEIRYADVPCP